MPTVAEQLRAAREAQGLTVYQIADATKIRTDHVRAMDEGDFDVFCALVFLRGFVRTYASSLKLDVPAIMASLDQELSGTEKFSELPPLTKERRGVLDWITYVLSRIHWSVALPLLLTVLLIIGAVFGYRAWRTHQSVNPLSTLGSGMNHDQKSPGKTLPIPQ
jgi:cytoskeletal protein RodZ